MDFQAMSTETGYSVTYECECGCYPKAEVSWDSDASDFEHCCCGRVHFIGTSARPDLEAYLARRRARGRDLDITYRLGEMALCLEDGRSVTVAYAEPGGE